MKEPKRKTKSVRIDAKTLIEVSADISDEEAIERFFDRYKHLRNKNYPPMRKEELSIDEAEAKPKLVPLEELPEMQDDEE